MTGIRDLMSYRLHVVANLLSRGAELRYRREFGVSLWEWRTIALLGGAAEPQSLNDLAHAAGIHKSQMSRVVSGLAARKLVVRSANKADGRGVRLTLSRQGRTVYEGLIGAAVQRDSVFRNCLSPRESRVFEKALNKLALHARGLIQEEKSSMDMKRHAIR
jgi:DNA-binding MarR family transcriptional regulator